MILERKKKKKNFLMSRACAITANQPSPTTKALCTRRKFRSNTTVFAPKTESKANFCESLHKLSAHKFTPSAYCVNFLFSNTVHKLK